MVRNGGTHGAEQWDTKCGTVGHTVRNGATHVQNCGTQVRNRPTVENDFDSSGMASLDEFWDAIHACIDYSGEITVRIESVERAPQFSPKV